MRRLRFWALIVAILTLTCPAVAQSQDWKIWKDEDQPAEYYSKEIRAKVVDMKTEKPIEGVTVTAQWILEAPFGGYGGRDSGPVATKKTITDKDGWFYIPAFGPIERPKFIMLRQKDPILIISKEGYGTLSLINASREYLIKKGITVKKLEEDQTGKPMRIIVKTFKFDEVDSDILNEGINQDSSEEIVPKGSIRESIWNGRTIGLKKL